MDEVETAGVEGGGLRGGGPAAEEGGFTGGPGRPGGLGFFIVEEWEFEVLQSIVISKITEKREFRN